MANLKDIRRRIKSVKNTQKITQAMRMVAAAKVKRAEAKMKATRPYAEALQVLMAQVGPLLQQALPDLLNGDEPCQYASFLAQRPVKRVALLVLSSDRGLCGAFNTNLLRRLNQRLADYQTEGILPRVYLVGNKAIQAIKAHHKDLPVLGRLSGASAAPSLQQAQAIAQALMQAYQAGSVDRIEVLSTRFKSLVSYQVSQQTLAPLSAEALMMAAPVKEAEAKPAIAAELLLEPDPQTVVDTLIPMYVGRMVHALMLESAASELAARMTAMANATDNAKKMLGGLTLVYNKARQASITQELMEIVGGAEALR